ncbi:hypothetical protein, partial [Phenylobacterium sp.]|uniref:hypothetical protein n=1 Tax=Phenylobacterium sp. TaxID=1871053 RepID=UPI0030F39808
MTAPLLNASTIQPTAATGAAAGLFGGGVATPGPMAGFEALLTAFFGGPGAAEPVLGADGKPVLKTGDAAKGAKVATGGDEEADTADTATPSTDAQILAALLAQPITAPTAVVPTTAGGPGADETTAGGPATPAFGPLAPDTGLALASKATGGADAKAANGAVAQAVADAATEAMDAEAMPTNMAAADPSSALGKAKPAVADQPAAAATPR